MTFPAHIAWETDIKYLQTDAMNSMYMYMYGFLINKNVNRQQDN